MTLTQPWGIIGPGGSGDWFKREVLPSIGNLEQEGMLHKSSRVLGVSRKIRLPGKSEQQSREAYQQFVRSSVDGINDIPIDDFLNRFYFFSASIDREDAWDGISNFCNTEVMQDIPNKAVIVSTAPSLVPPILRGIRRSSLLKNSQGRNIVLLEKPFGYSRDSCEKLFTEAAETFGDEVYPIDHYRGKIGILQLMCMRREDPLLSRIYRYDFVESVTIIANESDHLNARHATFTDMRGGTGSDMFISHLLTTALILAQPADALREDADKDFVRTAQLNTLADVKIEDCVWGQYDDQPGDANDKVLGLAKLNPSTPSYSKTPTFFSCKVVFNRGELAGVPFYIRTGKGLEKKHTEIIIRLKKSPISTRDENRDYRFVLHSDGDGGVTQDSVYIPCTVRTPDISYGLLQMQLNVFSRAKAFVKFRPYSKLLDSAMKGNWKDFLHPQVLTRLWDIFEPTLQAFEQDIDRDLERLPEDRRLLHLYPFGSSGPDACMVPKIWC